MTDRPRSGLAALCVTQTTSWGQLYRSLLVASISQDMGRRETTLTAALSLGLIISAIAGLASTIFGPIVAYLIGQLGWRVSYLIFAHCPSRDHRATARPFSGQHLDITTRPYDRRRHPTKPDSVARSPRFITLQAPWDRSEQARPTAAGL